MILIVHTPAGHGHQMAALALQEELKSRNVSEPVEILDELSTTPKIFSDLYAGGYWFMVHYFPFVWGFFFWLFNLRNVHRVDQFMKRNFETGALLKFERLLEEKNPRRLVFTHFLGIHNAIQLKKRAKITSFIRAVVTDFYAHALWIDDEVDEYCVMSEETRKDMIERWGISHEKIRVTGIPVLKKFIEPLPKKGKSTLEDLGLEEKRLTLLFTSGSFGIGPTERFLEILKPLASNVQAIVVCGNNLLMKDRLSGKKFPFPVAVLGFVSNMNELMDIAHVLVAKPGGITTCEALIKSIPLVVSNVIPGQEAGNLRLLEKYDACWRVHTSEKFLTVVKNILGNPSLLQDKKKNCLRLAKPNAARDIVEAILK